MQSTSDQHQKLPGTVPSPAAQDHPPMSPGKDCPVHGDSTHNQAGQPDHPPFGRK